MIFVVCDVCFFYICDYVVMIAPLTLKQYVSQLQTIPSGRFTMGRTYEIEDVEGFFKDEVPAQSVDVSSFRLGATPVTVGMWREYVRADPSLSMPDAPEWGWIDNHPMVNVSWNDIMGRDGMGGYCRWASKVSGVRLRLPSEAMFEYAAKGGRDDKYPWGNTFDRSKLWCFKAVGDAGKTTASVDRTDHIYRNAYGLTDISGNVVQWCFDFYGPYSSQKRDHLGYPIVVANPEGAATGRFRCVRGGSWDYIDPHYFRCANRLRYDPDVRDGLDGFRISAGLV